VDQYNATKWGEPNIVNTSLERQVDACYIVVERVVVFRVILARAPVSQQRAVHRPGLAERNEWNMEQRADMITDAGNFGMHHI
jgi:hypothetical protein